MAESVVGGCILSAVSSICQKLIPIEHDHIQNVDVNINKLNDMLDEADEMVKGWHLLSDDIKENKSKTIMELNRLYFEAEDRVYEIESVMEKRNSRSLHRRPAYHAIKSTICCICCKPRGIAANLKKLRDLKQRLEHNKLPTEDPGKSSNWNFDPLKWKNQETDYTESIIKELLKDGLEFHGVSIIGIRGLGKSALANNILHNVHIKNKFSRMLKISASELDLNNMKPKLINDNDKGKGKEKVEDNENYLTEDKWLLWVDDLSEAKCEFWSNFTEEYLAKANGNRKILITTVNPTVSEGTKTSRVYLQDLSESCCGQLISKTILLSYKSDPNKYDINKVAKKCYGLPSIATSMAWQLALNNQDVIDKELWKVPAFQEELLPYLTSSFRNLQSNSLKSLCFLSLFPQDHQFNKEDLILLYIGVGLDKPHLSSLRENKCFKDLVEKSFLQARDNPPKYQMNKFTHGLIEFAAPKTYVQLSHSSMPTNLLNDINVCHLSLTHDIDTDIWNMIKTRRCLRTFLALHNPLELPRDLFSSLSYLRVLVLKSTKMKVLPNHIKRLKRLRFLDVSETQIEKLPMGISTTLQILRFKKNDEVIPALPNDISRLTNLFSLDWNQKHIRKLEEPPRSIGKLTKLETLPFFEVGSKKGHRVTELKGLKALRGCIWITNLHEVRSKEEAKKARMSEKTSLDKLILEWTDPVHQEENIFQKLKQGVKKLVKGQGNRAVEDVLEGLKPHSNLKELMIIHYGGAHLPRWLSSMGKLQKIHLQNCPVLSELPSLTHLTSLDDLIIEGCKEISSLPQLPPSLKCPTIIDGSDSLNDQVKLMQRGNDAVERHDEETHPTTENVRTDYVIEQGSSIFASSMHERGESSAQSIAPPVVTPHNVTPHNVPGIASQDYFSPHNQTSALNKDTTQVEQPATNGVLFTAQQSPGSSQNSSLVASVPDAQSMEYPNSTDGTAESNNQPSQGVPSNNVPMAVPHDNSSSHNENHRNGCMDNGDDMSQSVPAGDACVMAMEGPKEASPLKRMAMEGHKESSPSKRHKRHNTM